MPFDLSLSTRESIAINIMKAIGILSVISAHVVSLSYNDQFSRLVTSLWSLFGKSGVIIFFTIGGFLYKRNNNDSLVFWKKKLIRIILPWFFCSSLTYAIASRFGQTPIGPSYVKWVLGSGTWYYYVTIYTLFLFLFKWFYSKDIILYGLIIAQCSALLLASFGISTTPHLDFVTDYLNPLHWIGYFSFGILCRKYRLDLQLRKHRYVIIIACLFASLTMWILYKYELFTYFHIVSSVFCTSVLIIVADFAYRIADRNTSQYIARIGSCSYCIYLLHMQIVQAVVSWIPDNPIKLLLSPFIGLGVMMFLITIGLSICKKIPKGRYLKSLVGL